jgi:hypothetical protein
VTAPIASAPWSVRVEKVGDPDEPFIQRTIIGKNLGGGEEVAIVTTGSYTDQVEALHAQLMAAAPGLLVALELARPYVDEAQRRMYDGTGGHAQRQEAARRLAWIDTAIKDATEVPPL